jgi:arginase
MSRDRSTLQRVQKLTAIEVACGDGARDPRCQTGPIVFRHFGTADLLTEGVTLDWRQMPANLRAGDCSPRTSVIRCARWIAQVAYRLTVNGEKFVVIGGDHSIAIGTWSGVSDALRQRGPLGLVWIDAHMDMHTPSTSPSGAFNGMPIACLLGYGEPELTAIAKTGPAIDPRHICLVGVRSFEAEEGALAGRLGIPVIDMSAVHRDGIGAALQKAQEISTNGTAGYGVSLDLDAFDPADAPGVGTPAPNGLDAAEFLAPWSRLVRDPRCLAIEIVEFNPSRDRFGRTARLMCDIIAASV